MEWRGKYFQSGLGNVVIKDSHITSKGHCIEEQRDYYLFSNKLEIILLSGSYGFELVYIYNQMFQMMLVGIIVS